MNGLSNNILGFFFCLKEDNRRFKHCTLPYETDLNKILLAFPYCQSEPTVMLLFFINVICAYFNSLVCFIFVQAMCLGQRCISFVEGTRCSNPCLPMTRHCVSRILLCPIYL